MARALQDIATRFAPAGLRGRDQTFVAMADPAMARESSKLLLDHSRMPVHPPIRLHARLSEALRGAARLASNARGHRLRTDRGGPQLRKTCS